MRRSLLMTVALALAFASRVAADDQIWSPHLVPWPQKVTMTKGAFLPPKNIFIKVVGKNSASARRVAETLTEDLTQVGFKPTRTGKSPGIVLQLTRDKSLGREGYRLEAGKDIRITAATDTGLFWGTRTALQLLAKGPVQWTPQLSIFDKPLLPMRVVMVDVARQFHSIEFHRQFVKKLASYKLNTYHIHFTDDQSWTLPSSHYPALPTAGRNYTVQELRDLVKLAARYHVMIIPEIDMPGHCSAICKGVPDVLCRWKGAYGPCAGSNRSFEVFRNVVSDAMDIFPAPYFHIGADEVDYHMWDNCPDCTARKISEGLKDNVSLYNWFINRMNRFVRSNGRRTIAWTGFKPTTQPAIDKNVLVDQWDIGYANPLDLLKAGYDLINSSSTPLYVVRDWSSPPEKIAEWDVWHFGLVNEPPPYLAPKMSPSPKLKGVGFCSWENAENVQDVVLFGIGKQVDGYSGPAPRVPLMAERGWTGSATSAKDLLTRVGVTSK